jgi:DNA-binding transcriptional regulator YiaG
MRKSLGMTQAALAAALGVGWSTVARWEAGIRGKRGIPEPAARLIGRLLEERRPKRRKE